MSNRTIPLIVKAKEANEGRVSFEQLPQAEQLLIVYDMLAYVRASIASMEKRNIEFQEDVYNYRRQREQSENSQSLTTHERIEKILAGKFDAWAYFRDKILPPVLIAIVLGILYLVFGK